MGKRRGLAEIKYTITNGTPGKRRAKISKVQAARKQAGFSSVNEPFILEWLSACSWHPHCPGKNPDFYIY